VILNPSRGKVERLPLGHELPPGRGGGDDSIERLMIPQPAFLERER
jgi:hypothetical protein